MGQFSESMETIAFQINSNLPKAIADIFQKVIDIKAARPETDQLFDQLMAMVRTTTGLFVTPVILEGKAARGIKMFVLDPNFNAFSPINLEAGKLIEKYDLKNLETIEILKGKIDRKNCKVSGFYSRIPFRAGISSEMFNGDFTAGELASVYFHELGHPWTICEFLGQSLLTNVILAELVGRMDMQESSTRKFALGRAALKLAENDQKIPSDVSSSVITALVLEGQVKRMQVAYNTRWYDARLKEAVADQFTARWGMGRDLVTALGKLERSKGFGAEDGYNSPVWGALSNLLTIVMLPYGFALQKGLTALTIHTLKRLAFGFAASFFISGAFYGMLDESQPPMAVRIRAIRNQVVTLLKDRDLPKEERERALADLEVIDKEAADVHPFVNVMGQLVTYSLDLISGKGYDIGANQMKENLANNRFFEFSATHQR